MTKQIKVGVVDKRFVKAAYLQFCYNAYVEGRADLYLSGESLEVYDELKNRKRQENPDTL